LKISELQEAETEMLGQLRSVSRDKLTLKSSSYLIDREEELKKLYTNLASQLKTDDWTSRPVIDLNNKIIDLEQKVGDEIERIVDENGGDLTADDRHRLATFFKSQASQDIMTSKKSSLQDALSEVENRAALLPEHQAELERLDREINAAREFRDQFKKQLEGFQISQAILGQSKISLIEPAKMPFAPIAPDRKMITLMAFMLGLVLGITIIIVVELFDSSIKNIDRVKSELGLDVLGTIPKIEKIKSSFGARKS